MRSRPAPPSFRCASVSPSCRCRSPMPTRASPPRGAASRSHRVRPSVAPRARARRSESPASPRAPRPRRATPQPAMRRARRRHHRSRRSGGSRATITPPRTTTTAPRTRLRRSIWRRRGVVSASPSASNAAMRPISVRSPVALTSTRPRPRVTAVPLNTMSVRSATGDDRRTRPHAVSQPERSHP